MVRFHILCSRFDLVAIWCAIMYASFQKRRPCLLFVEMSSRSQRRIIADIFAQQQHDLNRILMICRQRDSLKKLITDNESSIRHYYWIKNQRFNVLCDSWRCHDERWCDDFGLFYAIHLWLLANKLLYTNQYLQSFDPLKPRLSHVR